MSEAVAYVVLDVESTGLNPWTGDLLLEVAALVVQPRYPYEPIDGAKPFQAVINQNRFEAFNQATTYVQDMHAATGLWDRLEGGWDLEYIDIRLANYLAARVPAKGGWILGNSIRLDLNFLEAFLPQTYDWLDYHSIDVTAVAQVAYADHGVPPYPKKRYAHRAAADLQESLAQLRWVHEHTVKQADEDRS